MGDPLSDIMGLLHPRTVFTKVMTGAGDWAVRYAAFGRPSFATVLTGGCRLAVEGAAEIALCAGDFVLVPATPAFGLSAGRPVAPRRFEASDQGVPLEEVRHGDAAGPSEVRLLGGYIEFESPETELFLSLLPVTILVRDSERLATLVRMVDEEVQRRDPGRELVLMRLVEILLIEALRTGQHGAPAQGILRGLADPRLSVAIRLLHEAPERAWTVTALARQAGLSRSSFFERFARVVGVTPMDYLLGWRMALARDLLRREGQEIAEVAARVGYGSPSTFSTAFRRHTGVSPGRYARGGAVAAGPADAAG